MAKNKTKRKEPALRTNIIYNSAYQLFAILVPLITTPYLSRTIGAFGIGEYGYAYSVAFYFTIFIKLGLNNYGSREIALFRQSKEKTSKKFWEIYTTQAFLCAALTLIYILYSLFISNNKNISFLFILMVLSAGIDVTWFFWGLEEFKLTAKRDFVIKLITTASIFLFVKNEDDTWKYCLLMSASLLLSQLLLLPSLKNRISWSKPSKESVIRHIKPNLTLFIPIIAISIYKTMDKIMLGAMTSENEVGYYQSSDNVIQVPIALITSLGTVMQPRISKMIADNKSRDIIDRLTKKSMTLAILLSTSIGFGIMSVSKEFVPLFYGDGFGKCITLFSILLPSCIFVAFANVIRTQYLIPNKKDRQYVISLLVGAAINLVLNALLIPRLQSIGAAIGTLVAETSVCISQVILVRKEMQIRGYITLSIPFLISGTFMYLLWNNKTINIQNNIISLIVKIVLAASTYLLSLSIIYFVIKSMKKLSATKK